MLGGVVPVGTDPGRRLGRVEIARPQRGEDPEAELLEQIAAHAQALAVVEAGRTAAVVGRHMVDLSDGRIAPGGAAGGVAPADHPGEAGGEGSCTGFHADQLAGARLHVQPPVERRHRLVGMGLLGVGLLGPGQVSRRGAPQGVGDDVGGQCAVPLEPGAFGVVAATQQSRVGDDDPDVEAGCGARTFRCSVLRHRAIPHVTVRHVVLRHVALRCIGLRRATVQCGVHEQIRLQSRDGLLRPGRPQGLGSAVEGLHHPGGIDPAQHGADLSHAVGQRRHRHVPGTGSALGPLAGPLGLELLDQHLHLGAQRPLSGARQRQRVRADQLVDAGDGVRVRPG